MYLSFIVILLGTGVRILHFTFISLLLVFVLILNVKSGIPSQCVSGLLAT